jgi:hypothetical protein
VLVSRKIQYKKKKILIGVENINQVNNDITKLHLSENVSEFNVNWKIIKTNWSKIKELDKFTKYFEKQWIKSPFNTWSIEVHLVKEFLLVFIV